MTRYAVGLGSNIGDRLGHMQRACAALAGLGTDLSIAPLYESAPVGGPDQDPYLNSVVVLESDLAPGELLDRLHEIEHEEGRERKTHWGPRTLDLDIVSTDGSPISTEVLTVPHPRASEREFVLRPLVEVWPEAPVAKDLTAAGALAGMEPQDVDLLARVWLPPRPLWPAYALVAGQFILMLTVAVVIWLDGTLPREATVTGVLGAALVLLGLGLALAAARRLGVSLSAVPVPRPGAHLVTGGPFRAARHPIYGGISLAAIGTGLAFDSLWGMVMSLILLVFFWFKSSYEERQLRIQFADYRAYRGRVTRRLIPGVL